MAISVGKFLSKLTTSPPSMPGDPVVALAEPGSAVAEAYRTIRTNLQYANLDQEKKSILVTSAGPGEGKSTTVANLGVTMAKAGSRTLLVDSDLRRPTLHRLFNVANDTGLTTVLTDMSSLPGGIVSTQLSGLCLLPSGPIPPNPAEVLGSRRMLELVEQVRAEFDLVLYDSPPVIAVSDPLVLTSLTEAVILVVKCGRFPHELIRQAKAQLEGVKANVLGVLLNSVDFKRDGYYYHSYYDSSYTYGSQNGAR